MLCKEDTSQTKSPTSPIKLIPLQPEFYRELIAETICRKHYLSHNERAAYKVNFKKTVVDGDGNPLQGRYIYVLMYENNKLCLYAAKDGEIKNHSYLASGKSVAGAGYLIFKDGKLILFSNESGHYKPTVKQMHWALAFFIIQSQNTNLLFDVHSENKQDPRKVDINRYFAIDMYQSNSTSILLSLFSATHESAKESRFLGAPKQLRVKKSPKELVKETSSKGKNNNNNSKEDSEYEEELKISNPLSLLEKNNSEKKDNEHDDDYDEMELKF